MRNFIYIRYHKSYKGYVKLGKTKYTVLRQTNIIGKYDKTDLDKAHFFSSIVQK